MDPHHHYNTIRPPPPPSAADPRQPPPPGQQWYPPSQYQYQPPPPQNQWGPPPPHSYPQIHSQYLPPHSHRPHLPPPYPHPQDWGNTNWGHHPGWEYPARQDEEDWAAKARAWAASKDANDQQHPQYNQKVENNYSDIQSSNPSPGYHPYPANSSAPSSFDPDEHFNYGAKDGRFSGDSNAVYHHPESSSVSSLVHMQEVSSSYSSIAGNVETGDGREKLYNSFSFPADSNQAQFHDHLPHAPVGRSVLMEHPHYGANNHATELPIALRDQPLNFTRRSSFDHEPIMQNNFHNNNDIGRPVRDVDPGAAPSSHYSFTSAHMPGASYPPFPPIPSSAQQHGLSANLTSSFPGNPTPSFGMMSGPGFQSPIPAIGIGSTSGLHPTAVFSGDIYGVSGSDRPKKAPIPDWLKEEIIKNKAIIASSGPARPIDSIEDDTFDKTPGRGDQEDSQSVGSPRSAVEEDEEDNMEAVRTAELNKEIKRILTEVLLKVTDDLFDEIATQVLEEDLTTQVANDTVAPDCKPAFAISAVSSSKASAKVLVAAQAKEIESGDESEKSISISPGDLLGLASYASDDDEDDSDNNIQNQTSTKKISENDYAAENENAQAESESGNKSQIHGNNHKKEVVSNGVTIHHDALRNVHHEMETIGRSFDGNGRPKSSSIMVSEVVADEPKFEGRKTVEMPGTSKPNNSLGEKVVKSETIQSAGEKISAADESWGGETRNKQDNKDNDPRKSYVGRDSKDKKGVKEEERYEKREKTTDKNNDSKEKMKEQGGKYGEKAKESDLKKMSSDHDGKMGRKEKERDRRYNNKDDSDRKRERKKDEKEERSRDKHKNELNRHRRRRSSSGGDRGRSSKGNSLAGHVNCSSDESSDGSKRKLHRKRCNLSRSPSPSRSRKRQDSRSPPSKRSHRRHSPFSSLETTRGRRSRSRSPVRRRR